MTPDAERDKPPTRTLDLTISALTYRGEGLGVDVEGRRWAVPKTLPGERVQVALVPDHRGRLWPRLLRVLEPSDDRRDPNCPHDARCPGCQLRALTPTQRLAQRHSAWRQALARLAELPPERVLAPAPAAFSDGYRARARARPILDEEGRLVLGMRPLRGHDPRPVPLASCPAQSRRTRELLERAQTLLRAHDIAPLDRSGACGLAEVRVDEGHEGAARVTLVSPEPPDDALRAVAARLHDDDPRVSILHGVLSLRDPGLPLRDLQRLHGPPRLALLDAAHRPIECSPEAWVSATPRLAERVRAVLLEAVRREPAIDALLEIGCGVGVHTLDLAPLARAVIAVDASRAAIEDAQRNLSGDAFEHVTVRLGRADRAVRRLLSGGLRADLVVLHGMRKPFGPRLCRALAPLRPRAIAYVTPSVFALGEDMATLQQVGFDTRWVQPMNTMPGTYHMMAVGWMVSSEVS